MKFDWKGAQASAAIQRAGKAGLLKAGNTVLDKSNSLVPLKDGELQSSGGVTQEDTVVHISYNTDYAIKQHEDTRLRHPNGRQSKFLETALKTSVGDVLSTIANEIEGAMR